MKYTLLLLCLCMAVASAVTITTQIADHLTRQCIEDYQNIQSVMIRNGQTDVLTAYYAIIYKCCPETIVDKRCPYFDKEPERVIHAEIYKEPKPYPAHEGQKTGMVMN